MTEITHQINELVEFNKPLVIKVQTAGVPNSRVQKVQMNNKE